MPANIKLTKQLMDPYPVVRVPMMHNDLHRHTISARPSDSRTFYCWLDHMDQRRMDMNCWEFDCKGCSARFPSRKALEDHLRMRLYDCRYPNCRMSFVHKNELLTHQLNCPGRLVNSNYNCYKSYCMI